jgi:hypothetical protein
MTAELAVAATALDAACHFITQLQDALACALYQITCS